MRKTAILVSAAILMLALTACNPDDTTTTTNTTSQTSAVTTTTEAMTEMTAAESTAAETSAATPTTVATMEPSPTPTPGPVMYSSYAHMVTYDPARGLADFDYFNMLRGDDAVQFLVDHEGYTVEDAQTLVDDFADSEFIEQNLNPQLRTIDLDTVDLKLMFQPDGTMVTGAVPLDSELIDLFNLFQVDQAKVLDYFFYYITVEGGVVVTVEQVYWP